MMQTSPSNDDIWGQIDTLRMLLYGESGSGKTTLWATFPGPILALICSGGRKPGELRSINTPEYRKKITPRIVNSSDDLAKYLEEAENYATVVLDHSTGLADMKLKEILGIDELPVQKSWGMASQQQYGQLSIQCKESFRALLNLPGNIVIVAQQRTFGGETDGNSEAIAPTVGAALTPSVTGWLNPACDFVVQMFKRAKMVRKEAEIGGKKVVTWERGKGIEYCLRTEPHDIYQTKFRIPKGQPLPDVIVDPSYEKILKLITG